MVIIIILFILGVAGYKINSGCSDQCNDCINSNARGSNIYTKQYCEFTAKDTSFIINVHRNKNGCGYAKDINDVYNKCINECQACHKYDSKCESFTDHPSSTIVCKPSQCIPRGGIALNAFCCEGLFPIDFKCIDPKTDCTPCGQKIIPGKPCCDTSGIYENGKWRCASRTANECKVDRECPRGQCCNIKERRCVRASKDKDTGQNNVCG
jgi:hypothetical protein